MRAKSATGVDRVVASQEARGKLRDRLAALHAAESLGTFAILEAEFVRVAKHFGESREFGYGAWRRSRRPVGCADPSRDRPYARVREITFAIGAG